MPITRRQSAAALERMLQAKIQARINAFIAKLTFIGEECLTEARANHLYLNQTGNLCSSIGYVIIYDGAVVSEGSWQHTAGRKGDGSQGMVIGKTFIDKLISEQSPGEITFAMVAGMPYAKYVEKRKPPVLNSARNLAEAEIRDALKQMVSKK